MKNDASPAINYLSAEGTLRVTRQADAGVMPDLLQEGQLTSPRFVWMAYGKTDEITEFPATFLESTGTSGVRPHDTVEP